MSPRASTSMLSPFLPFSFYLCVKGGDHGGGGWEGEGEEEEEEGRSARPSP